MRLIVAVACLLLVASCANIPEQTNAYVIPNSSAQPQQRVQLPDRDADPIMVVRKFIEDSGDTAMAEAYLTDEAKRLWRPDSQPTIVDDDFSTVPRQQAKDADPETASVEVKSTTKGRLDSHKSFIPQVKQDSGIVKLVRKDGQWRISETPNNAMIIPISSFTNNYRPVKLYFYDTSKEVPVPDQRFLPGSPLPSASEIISLLLQGPATGLQGAVHSAIPSSAVQRTNATTSTRDGATIVNLGMLGDQTIETKRAIATQIVLSLQDVPTTTVRLQVEDMPLVPDQPDWKVSDVQADGGRTTPRPGLNGMMVVGNRVKDLRDGKPIANPAGSGEYRVESAAQSVDGSQLAVVERLNNGEMQLRVGGLTEGLRAIQVTGTEMTRPTWQYPVASNEIGKEVWVVANNTINRAVRNREGTWMPLPVNQSEIEGFGKITELRLSRDGVRVAVVADGKLVVGAVVRANNSTDVAISAPKQLLPSITNVVGVDWLDNSRLVVATNSPTGPVWQVPVDGIQAQRYNLANLTLPLSSITAAPSRQIVVTDAVGMWTASDIGQVWLPHPQSQAQGPGARPFYPG
ncbi:LpqB family beta-propeller domain-containing protein [Kibdelosporangium philippinense]|uniref:LpqB family beta-propeller domain-containing protein n=1 Tax=Kibdelosporangium philippinense TaxID=211113 RepID=A0ABS8ZE23_9PSEU|nr:LpqB family beta-propeller domain-containing protein [Kibdelosporangium philippinense]MCE7006083.1 LpqB family beta-propeller domain-containing protein [Kibdelosporangium philippinense]